MLFFFEFKRTDPKLSIEQSIKENPLYRLALNLMPELVFLMFKRVNKFKRFNNEMFVTKNLNEVKTRSKLDCEVNR